MKIVTTNMFFNTFLKITGYKAITTPWRTVYVLPPHQSNQTLLSHEQVHLDQITRIGPFKFTVLYLWYNIRYGYWNNPFEVEARAKSSSS